MPEQRILSGNPHYAGKLNKKLTQAARDRIGDIPFALPAMPAAGLSALERAGAEARASAEELHDAHAARPCASLAFICGQMSHVANMIEDYTDRERRRREEGQPCEP